MLSSSPMQSEDVVGTEFAPYPFEGEDERDVSPTAPRP